ncbi:MAG: site-specific DNA-methyltransferase [Clostridia bacterium]|nr:site-specific DNA-methyltransferase [Clostridia bacterium]
MSFELNKIYFADCYEAIKQIPNKSVDLIVTDPPYDINVNHGAGAFGVKKKLHYEQFIEISNGYREEILDDFIRVLKRINLYIWCSKKQIPTLIDYFVKKRNCYWNLISWHKNNVCPVCNNTYAQDTEYCLFFREEGVRLYGNYASKKTYYVTNMNTCDKKKFKHPTIKRLDIIQNLISNSSRENDIVLDPFMGSGTTAVACKNLGRNFIGFEFNQQWHKIACDRLNNVQADGQITMFTD